MRWAAPLLLMLAACTGPDLHTLSPQPVRAYEVDLASEGVRLAAAWYGERDGRARIYLQPLTEMGKVLGPPLAVTDGEREAYEPDLAFLGDDYVVAWYEKPVGGGWESAWLARIDRNGGERWRRRLTAEGGAGLRPVVCVQGQYIHVAWVRSRTDGSADIWYARYDAEGAATRSPRIIAPASPDTWNLNASVDDAGRLHLVYDARVDTRAKELHHVIVDGESSRTEMLSADDGFDSLYPDIAIAGKRVALTWFDTRDGNEEVYVAAGTFADSLKDRVAQARRVTDTPGHSIGAYAAWNGPRLGVAWTDDTGGRANAYVQVFTPALTPEAPARVLLDTHDTASIPSIAPVGPGFAVAWNEYAQDNTTKGHGEIRTSKAMLARVR